MDAPVFIIILPLFSPLFSFSLSSLIFLSRLFFFLFSSSFSLLLFSFVSFPFLISFSFHFSFSLLSSPSSSPLPSSLIFPSHFSLPFSFLCVWGPTCWPSIGCPREGEVEEANCSKRNLPLISAGMGAVSNQLLSIIMFKSARGVLKSHPKSTMISEIAYP